MKYLFTEATWRGIGAFPIFIESPILSFPLSPKKEMVAAMLGRGARGSIFSM